MSPVNVLLVGSGAREHAIASKLLQSQKLGKLFIAPGNGGTTEYNIPTPSDQIQSLVEFAREKQCFTVIGPEAPLELGIVDALSKYGLSSFGPTKEQARLETSKVYAKEFMKSKSIPTAKFTVVKNRESALDQARSRNGDLVFKVDGLAAGKGVFVCSNIEEANHAIDQIFEKKVFGKAGDYVVVEEKLSGQEVSFIALSDGKNAIPFASAQDHKRLLDGDKGPNTGGMGAFSPAKNFGQEMVAEVMDKVVCPTIKATEFKGFLFLGLILTLDGPKVLEFNARFGDPEAECILPRLQSDLLECLLECDKGNLSPKLLKWSPFFATCIVMCAKGYPSNVEKGKEISGIERAKSQSDTFVFHGATKENNGKFFTNGGRVLCVSSIGPTLELASKKAYSAVNMIKWEGENHRSDIGV
ncbi:MAG: phosphoribosylamine--glycine ligase [Nitrososphaerales archaeon]